MEQAILCNLNLMLLSNVAKRTQAGTVGINAISITRGISTTILFSGTNNSVFPLLFTKSRRIDLKKLCNALPNNYAYPF